MPASPHRLQYAHGIHAIDAGYQRPMLAAIHLVIEDGQAALIDSGVNASVPSVMAVLAELGLPPSAVKWVMLTHVHLDHAGGAGLLLEHLPDARLTVHPRGAPHMRDPSRLIAGTTAVYGEQATKALYGHIRAIDPERIVETPDGARLTLGTREFEFIDTPGHARHHVCIVDHASQCVFTGDTFGLSYRELGRNGPQWVFPATTPVQFDPVELHRSIDAIRARRPKAIYLTHFGEVREVERKADDLHRLVQAHADIAARAALLADPLPAMVDDLRELVLSEARRQHCGLDEAALLALFRDDITLNADGLLSYLERTRLRPPSK